MCLATVDSKPRKVKNIAYKVMAIDCKNNLITECQGLRKSRPMGEWLDEADYAYVHTSDTLKTRGAWTIPSKYPRGWHCFVSKKQADEWHNDTPFERVVKVEMSDILATGYQHVGWITASVVVCRKIKILEICK